MSISTKVIIIMLIVGSAIGGALYWQHTGLKSRQKKPEPKAVTPVEVPIESPAEPTPEVEAVESVEVPIPERFGMHVLVSTEGYELEAQVLDVVGDIAFIRREDKKVFEIPMTRFAPASEQLILKWQSEYAHQVTPEQKAFLMKPVAEEKSKSEPASEPEPAPVEAHSKRGEPVPDMPYIKSSKPRVKWALVDKMSDEFEGRRIDKDKWQIEPKGNGWGWIGRPPGLFLADNVSVEDGKMKVTVSKLKRPEEVNGKEFLYQGAIVRSIHAGEPGWFYECKMKANATEMSSTFWLMTKGNTIKKLELDIQECVGVVSDDADPWAKGWDSIFHSNMIHRKNSHNPKNVQLQDSIQLKRKNCSRYYVYGAWWKSETEVLFYLDGKHVYTINPSIEWDVPAYLQMAMEVYDWNPVPERGSMVEQGSLEERTTQYEWIRTWKVVGKK